MAAGITPTTEFSYDGESCAVSSADDFESTIKLIASGGVAVADDLYRLREMGCEGAIVGKAFYEGRISFKELREFI